VPLSNSTSKSEIPYEQEKSVREFISDQKNHFLGMLQSADVAQKSSTVLLNVDLVAKLIIEIKSKLGNREESLRDLIVNHELIDYLVALYEFKCLLKSMMALKDIRVDAGQFVGFLESVECIEKKLYVEIRDDVKCHFFVEISRLFKDFAAEVATGKFAKGDIDSGNRILEHFANELCLIKFLLSVDKPEWDQMLKDAKPKKISETKTESGVFESIITFFSPKKQNSENKVIPHSIQNRQ